MCVRVEVTGGWTKLHNEEHHNLYSSSNVIRVIKSRMRNVAQTGDVRIVYIILARRTEGKT